VTRRTPLPRDAFPVTQRWTYLDHAGNNAWPQPVVDAMAAVATDMSRGGTTVRTSHDARIEEIRAAAARLMGVPADDVAFVKNTTEGLAFVAGGLDWQPGDRVVVPDLEFPSAIYPWLALADRGVVIDRVPPLGDGRCLPIHAFAEVIGRGPAPKVVTTSWVQFGRGWRTDLAALAAVVHGAGALLCVDVIQGLGVIPADFDRWGVDFASADAHKWLLGPLGTGLLYVRASCLDRLRPLEAGWASVAHREEWDNLDLVWDGSARRLEGGSANVAGIHGMGAGIDLLLRSGVDPVWQHVQRLGDRLCDGLGTVGATVLSDRSASGRSGIVTFSVEGVDPFWLAEALQQRRIVCSPRGGGIRVSPHGYNDDEDIDTLVSAVAELCPTP
jgi:cysteine desulfurase/selenocysteine lyase